MSASSLRWRVSGAGTVPGVRELAGSTGFVVALVPNVLSIAALLILAVALEVHVRPVEEPSLHATHGREYARYQTSAGRFLPGVGTTATA